VYLPCAGRAAFIGLGFADRGDSFDLLVSIQDHFKYVPSHHLHLLHPSNYAQGY